MNSKLKYKGYCTEIKYVSESGILYGKLEDIDDLITFECDDLKMVRKEFEETVDEYLAFCEETGKPPCKTYSGQFNVRTSPELHRKVLFI